MGTYSMKQEIKIFLAGNTLVELEDAYVDKKKDLRTEIHQQIKVLCMGAKMTDVHRIIVVNLKKENEDTGERELAQEQIPLKEDDLSKYVISHDAAWIPEKMDKEDAKTYVQTVGDSTWRYLLYFAKIYCARIDLYNDSLNSYEKSEVAKQPVCFEQIIHEQLINALNAIISKNMDKEFDLEFEEINKEEETKPPMAGKRPDPK